MTSIDSDVPGGEPPRTTEAAPAWQEHDFASILVASVAENASASTGRDPSQRRYGFRVGPLALLIEPDTRSEAVPSPVVTALPNSPRWLLGLINLRGNLVPVFDLKHLCGIEEPENHTRWSVLVLDIGEKAVGFPVDSLPTTVVNLTNREHLPPVPDSLVGCTGACYDADGSLWIEFRHEAFFASLRHNTTPAESPRVPGMSNDPA